MISVKISIELADGETLPPEAVAVQYLQNALAGAARMSIDEIVQMWRAGVEEYRQGGRPKHAHRRKESR